MQPTNTKASLKRPQAKAPAEDHGWLAAQAFIRLSKIVEYSRQVKQKIPEENAPQVPERVSCAYYSSSQSISHLLCHFNVQGNSHPILRVFTK